MLDGIGIGIGIGIDIDIDIDADADEEKETLPEEQVVGILYMSSLTI